MFNSIGIISACLLLSSASLAQNQPGNWANPTFQKVMDIVTDDNAASTVMHVVTENGVFSGLHFQDDDGEVHDANVGELVFGKVVLQRKGFDVISVSAKFDYKKNEGSINFRYLTNAIFSRHDVISGKISFNVNTQQYQMKDEEGGIVTQAVITPSKLGISSIDLQ